MRGRATAPSVCSGPFALLACPALLRQSHDENVGRLGAALGKFDWRRENGVLAVKIGLPTGLRTATSYLYAQKERRTKGPVVKQSVGRQFRDNGKNDRFVTRVNRLGGQ